MSTPVESTPKAQRTLEEAFDELVRERNVRIRCFPRWVAEGRMSKTDAHDRLDRISSAVIYLAEFNKSLTGVELDCSSPKDNAPF